MPERLFTMASLAQPALIIAAFARRVASAVAQRIDAVEFCCNVHRGVVEGAEVGEGVTNY
jgi:hypothetical protein